MNGFGHDSVYPERPALDTVVQAMSGLMSATMVDGVPTKAGISVSDQLGGLFGLLGVLAALEQREEHGGPGAILDLAMQDGSAWATHRLWNGAPVPRAARIVATVAGPVLEENGASAPVATVAEVLAHPQTAARELVVERPTADGSRWTVLGSPMRLRSTPAVVTSAMVRRIVAAARARGEDGQGLKTVIYGGGPMYLADIQDAIAVMGGRFVQIYGQGESPMTITALSRADHLDSGHPRHEQRLAGVGVAQSAVRVRVCGPDGHPVSPGRVGEIEVKGATVMAGYWGDPEATAEALRDGWLRTGDLGRLHVDGYLTLAGR